MDGIRTSLATILALSVLAGCGGDGDPGSGGGGLIPSAAAACDALVAAWIAPASIGLPSSGAQVTAATLVSADDALPEHCQVSGAIMPPDALQGFPIHFRLNLPSQWNERAMHFGGSGYNGTVVSATGPAPSAPPDVPAPLARGYATFGSDSGHSGGDASFALDGQALVDFASAQMKKTHDVAVALIRQRYGKPPVRTYWVGSSQGGREGLMVAQRFPADYDGVLARVPMLSFTGLQMQGNRIAQALARPGGWLNELKILALQQTALQACDGLDGLADGTIANYTACDVDPSVLACPGGGDVADTCLSSAQLATVIALHTPMPFVFPVAHGVIRYPGWGWGGEDDPIGNWRRWVTGSDPAGSGGLIANSGNQFVRFFVAQDPGFDPLAFTPTVHAAFRERIQQLSPLLDATDPDLTAFRARGGKLIIQEHGADYARSPFATLDYYAAVVATFGQLGTDDFLRLYLTPGADQGGVGGSGWPATAIDWVAILEAWVENGTPPADMLEQVQRLPQPPFTTIARRPLCRFPTYPQYSGTGDVNLLASYSCQVP